MGKKKKKIDNFFAEQLKEATKLGLDLGVYREYYMEGLEIGFTKKQIDFLVRKIKTYPTIDY